MISLRRRALSLVEVLVAVAILAAVFIPIFNMFVSGVESTKYTEDRLRAFSVAKRQIEAIRHAQTICRTSHRDLVAGYSFTPYKVDNRYLVTTTVEPEHLVSENGVKAHVTYVKVEVNWKLNGNERKLVLETFLDRAYN